MYNTYYTCRFALGIPKKTVKMDDLKMDWLAYAKTASASDGKAYAADENGRSFILEWRRSDILSPALADFKKELSDLAAEKLSGSEFAFLKANPESASADKTLLPGGERRFLPSRDS